MFSVVRVMWGGVIEMGMLILNPLGYELVYDYASPVPGVGTILRGRMRRMGVGHSSSGELEFSYEWCSSF